MATIDTGHLSITMEVTDMAKSYRTSLVVALVAIASMLVLAGPALAKTQYLAHRCGGAATSNSALMAHWGTWGITDDMAQTYGLSSVDVSLKTYVNQTFGTFTLAEATTIHDNGCNPGRVTPVGDKTLKPGTLIFGDKSGLNAKYGRGGWSSTFHHGWHAVKVRIRSRAMTTCTNPISGWVTVWVWVAPAHAKSKSSHKAKTPAKKAKCSNTSGTSVGDCNQQNNSATVDQSAKVTPTCNGKSTDSANCNTVIIQNTTVIQINAVCSKVTVNFSDGTSSVTFKDSNGNVVTENYCTTTTTTSSVPSVNISLETINDIPVNLVGGVPVGSCRPVHIAVDSTAAGSVVVKPQSGAIGTVSCDDATSQRPSVTLTVAAGHTDCVVYVWAPADANAATDTLTATPVIAGLDAQATKAATASETYTISHPARA